MEELLRLCRKDALFIVDLVVLENKIRLEPDALKELALKDALADLLHLGYV